MCVPFVRFNSQTDTALNQNHETLPAPFHDPACISQCAGTNANYLKPGGNRFRYQMVRFACRRNTIYKPGYHQPGKRANLLCQPNGEWGGKHHTGCSNSKFNNCSSPGHRHSHSCADAGDMELESGIRGRRLQMECRQCV